MAEDPTSRTDILKGLFRHSYLALKVTFLSIYCVYILSWLLIGSCLRRGPISQLEAELAFTSISTPLHSHKSSF